MLRFRNRSFRVGAAAGSGVVRFDVVLTGERGVLHADMYGEVRSSTRDGWQVHTSLPAWDGHDAFLRMEAYASQVREFICAIVSVGRRTSHRRSGGGGHRRSGASRRCCWDLGSGRPNRLNTTPIDLAERYGDPAIARMREAMAAASAR